MKKKINLNKIISLIPTADVCIYFDIFHFKVLIQCNKVYTKLKSNEIA